VSLFQIKCFFKKPVSFVLKQQNKTRIGVGAQVNFKGARHFCPKNMYEKLTKCPNFTQKLPENFFCRILALDRAPLPPPSPCPMPMKTRLL